MARHKSDRKHFGTDGGAEKLPKGIYANGTRLLVKLSVAGKQHSLGSYPDLTTAVCERDRALHLLSDWVVVPPDVMPMSDLALLPPNKLLDRLLLDLAARGVPTLAMTRGTPLPPVAATPAPKDERRERFALLAMPVLLNNPALLPIASDTSSFTDLVAQRAVAMADSLISQLDTPLTQPNA